MFLFFVFCSQDFSVASTGVSAGLARTSVSDGACCSAMPLNIVYVIQGEAIVAACCTTLATKKGIKNSHRAAQAGFIRSYSDLEFFLKNDWTCISVSHGVRNACLNRTGSQCTSCCCKKVSC